MFLSDDVVVKAKRQSSRKEVESGVCLDFRGLSAQQVSLNIQWFGIGWGLLISFRSTFLLDT
jgi:hypothetical protein